MTTVNPFPHRYDLELQWQDGPRGELAAGPRPAIMGGPPPQFGGEDSWWSPEHLLLASASLCLMTTYMAVAAKSGLKVLGYRCSAQGTLDKTEAGLAFTAVTLKVSLRAAAREQERALRLLETAKRHCIVSNSLKTPVTVEGSVLAEAGAAH